MDVENANLASQERPITSQTLHLVKDVYDMTFIGDFHYQNRDKQKEKENSEL